MGRTRVTVGLVALAVGAALLIAAIAGNGSSTHGRASGSFAWLRPAAAPTGWNVARTPGGSTFAYPPGWRSIKTDPGTASVALLRGGRVEAYLNATPRQGGETLPHWGSLPPHHKPRAGGPGLR